MAWDAMQLLQNNMGSRHSFVWVDLKYMMYFESGFTFFVKKFIEKGDKKHEKMGLQIL